MDKCKKTVFFFADYWDDMWRRRQQLAWRLAQTDLMDHVVYIERPLPITSFFKFLVGHADRDGRDRWRRVISNRSWIMSVGKKISVLTTFAPLPPMGSEPLFRFSERDRDRWILWRLRKYFKNPKPQPIVWVSHPQISVEVIKALQPRLLWYDCTEDFSDFPGFPDCARAQIKATDRWLTERADVVTAVSRLLYEEKQQINPNTHWLPNAVDTKLFLQAPQNFRVPPDLQGVSRPALAFIGGLNNWAHDWELLDNVATLRPKWTILLIGGMNLSWSIRQMLRGHSNILCVGQKAYQELPAYVINSDVCFQFYKQSRKNDTGNSQKLFLYFAAGKPVISTLSADVEAYREMVEIVETAEDFVVRVEKVIREDNRATIKTRKEIARENSWDVRGERIFQILADMIQLQISALE